MIHVMLHSTQERFCYISLALAEHLFENVHVFFSFKKLYVSNFMTIKEENDSSLQ